LKCSKFKAIITGRRLRRMPVKDKIKLTVRGYKTIHSLVPGYLLAMGIQAVVSALLPFINIYMSAKIINALIAGEKLQQILLNSF
jgi:ATP-binding cassette subfamily B protein